MFDFLRRRKSPLPPMTRRRWRGHTLNVRTIEQIKWVEEQSGFKVKVTKGSYRNSGTSTIGSTHAGGGVFDCSVANMTPEEIDGLVQVLRKAGFAAWHRTPEQGPWKAHIHAVSLDDPDLSIAAQWQTQSFLQGRNGLRSNAVDHTPRPNPPVTWNYALKTPTAVNPKKARKR